MGKEKIKKAILVLIELLARIALFLISKTTNLGIL